MIEEEKELTEDDLFADFDTDLFYQQPKIEIGPLEKEPEEEKKSVCPFYPMTCDWSGTWRCTDKCKYNPDNYMQREIREVFEKTPHALYCFDCTGFVDTRPHENNLDPVEPLNSHTVTTGFVEYRSKLTEWTLKRIQGR